MSDQLYEMLANGLRYWFVLLGALIVVRSFLWLRRDRKEQHERVRRLPDAGSVGETVVLSGPETLPEGSVLPLPPEGIVGSVRSADIWLPSPYVAREHLSFAFRPGYGVTVRPAKGCVCVCDGREVTRKNAAAQPPLTHGSVLGVGDVTLRLRFFAGVDAGDPPDAGIELYRQDSVQPGPYDRPPAMIPPEAPPLREPPPPPPYREEEGWEQKPQKNPWTPG